MTKVLVTNDDGFDSPGLHALAGLAVELGLEVLVAAPARESSGASASLGAVEERGRVVVEPRPIGALPGVESLAVRAAPAFIVRAALHGAFGHEPDLVLSGVNQGPNTGRAVLHSGTVGAAMTAATYGRRSLAVSLAAGGDQWRWATAVTSLDRWSSGSSNPARSPCSTSTCRTRCQNVSEACDDAPLASFGAVQTKVTEVGHGYVHLEYSEIDPTNEPDSDAGLLAHNWACITPLVPLCEGSTIDLNGLHLVS